MENTTLVRVTPRDFFLYLAIMVTLYVSAVSFVSLLFGIIDALYPDVLSGRYYDPYSFGMRSAIASLVVMYPLYIVFSRMVRKDIIAVPARSMLWVRRWFVYITLFVTGLAVAVDLVALINTFLGGEITIRFVLKVIAVLVVAGGIFGYYMYNIKNPENAKVPATLSLITIVAVIASIVGGFTIMGSPMAIRQLRLDQTRVNDLTNIQWQIIEHWRLKNELPADLKELEDPLRGFIVPVDPQTQASYEYRVLKPLQFELCATFGRKSLEGENHPYGYPMRSITAPMPPGGVALEKNFWDHEAGRQCFARTIDTDAYPPYSKMPGFIPR